MRTHAQVATEVREQLAGVSTLLSSSGCTGSVAKTSLPTVPTFQNGVAPCAGTLCCATGCGDRQASSRDNADPHLQLLHQAVGDVAASRLTGSDDLHNLWGRQSWLSRDHCPLARGRGRKERASGIKDPQGPKRGKMSWPLTCPRLIPKYRATGSPAWIRGSWLSRSLLGHSQGSAGGQQ